MKRRDDDTIRTHLQEAKEKANEVLSEALIVLEKSVETSKASSRALLLESRRTRMASRPGMKPPLLKKR